VLFARLLTLPQGDMIPLIAVLAFIDIPVQI